MLILSFKVPLEMLLANEPFLTIGTWNKLVLDAKLITAE